MSVRKNQGTVRSKASDGSWHLLRGKNSDNTWSEKAEIGEESPFGALPIGAASYSTVGTPTYAAPAALGGSDSNAGTIGSPKLTINAACAAVASGGTVIIRGGTYRETVGLPNRTMTIQNYPGEEVWLVGSRIVSGSGTAGWTSSLNGSTPQWVTDYNYNPTSASGVQYSGRDTVEASSGNTNLASWPDQVWIDRVPQKQVATRNECITGCFWVEGPTTATPRQAAPRLYIGTDPTGKVVEVTARQDALVTAQTTAAVTIRGIGVRDYGNHLSWQGTVRIRAGSVATPSLVENCEFHNMAGIGMTAKADGTMVKKCTGWRNGQMGFHSDSMSDGLWEWNWLYDNNKWAGTGKLFVGHAHGGMKTNITKNSTWRYNLFENNEAHGLWLDVFSDNAEIYGNISRDNANAGLFFEYSHTVIVAGNLCQRNGNGIQVYGYEADIFNNTCEDNAGMQIYYYRGNRTPLDGTSFNTNPDPWPCYVEGQTILEWSENACTAADTATGGYGFHPYHASGARVKNNICIAPATAGGTDDEVIRYRNYMGNTTMGTLFPIDIVSDYNLLHQRGSSVRAVLAAPAASSDNVTTYSTLAAAQAGTAFEDNSASSMSFSGDGEAIVDTTVAALPANVQAVLGVSSAPRKGWLGVPP
jgi:hypothetical protein